MEVSPFILGGETRRSIGHLCGICLQMGRQAPHPGEDGYSPRYPLVAPFAQGAKPSSVTVSKDTAHRYFVSILLEEDIKPLPVGNSQVGLDLGLKSMAITSGGHTYGNPQFAASDEKKLAKAQRRHAKKKKGSKKGFP